MNTHSRGRGYLKLYLLINGSTYIMKVYYLRIGTFHISDEWTDLDRIHVNISIR
jgi:hypothetical protein